MRVAVVGDPMRDRYYIGNATRLSPEAPIPVVKVESMVEFPGGAANVAANLEALGVQVGKVYNPFKCPIKSRLMVGNTQLARWDEFDTCAPFATYLPAWVETPYDAIIVADYVKGSVDSAVVDLIRKTKVPVFVDTKGDPTVWRTVENLVAVFPNAKEYAQYKNAYNGFKLCVLKQGPEGMSLMSMGERWLHQPALAKNVVSVNGAGDTVIASFVYKYLLDGSYESKANRAIRFASIAAGIVVGKPYTATVSLEEIELGYDRR